MAQKRRTKSEQREETIARLVAVGREIFMEQGYAHAATEEIVQRAGVTRGALYHHFENKEGLFKAVLEDVQRDVGERILNASAQATDPWAELVVGCKAFLAASTDPKIQRIMLIDAPAVLGWSLWREIDAQYGASSLREILVTLSAQTIIKPLSVDALVHLLSGAMNEAALWIAQADQPDQALAEAEIALETLLESLLILK
jgi:AcrR family transcriptional regulator